MKKFLQIFAVISLVFLSSCVPPQRDIPPEEMSVSYQEFYDDLGPYGHWVFHPAYGYIWLPNAESDFVPYSTEGNWVWTDSYGWSWVSDYEWGWAPFHYGRWNFEPAYGWYWVPDLIWGPAWVAWREYPGYYGWCPLGPGIDVELAFNGSYVPPEFWWTGCDRHYFSGREMRGHFEHGPKIGRIRGGESRAIDNTMKDGGFKHSGFPAGPSKADVQAATGLAVTSVKIAHSTVPGESLQGGTWHIYRPQVQHVPSTQPQPIPRSVVPQSELRPIPSTPGHVSPQLRQEPHQNPVSNAQPRPEPRRESSPHSAETPRQQAPAKSSESPGKNPK